MKEFDAKMEGKEWEELLKHVYEHRKSEIELDGFRKGQVPFDVYVKRVGIENLYMDAVDHACEELLQKVLEENADVKPACRPTVNIKTIDKDSLVLTFGITEKPEVKLGKYKDLKIEKEKASVTDEEVEHELTHLRQQFTELKVKEGKVENNDEVNIDFEGFKDGEAFKGGKGENYNLVIGSNTFIPGFEEGLIGMSKGEEKDLNLKFPENYPSEDLKGKDVVFKVKVNEIHERILPDYDENFFKDLAMEGVDSLDKLKKEIKKNIEAHKTTHIEDEYFDKCLTKASENATIDVPSGMIEDEVDRMMDDFSYRLQMQGMNIDTYINMLGMTKDAFRDNFKVEAEKRVRYRLVIEEVVKKEDIKVTDEEVNDYLKEMASKYGVSEEEFLKEIGGKDYLKYDLQVRKAIEIITK